MFGKGLIYVGSVGVGCCVINRIYRVNDTSSVVKIPMDGGKCVVKCYLCCDNDSIIMENICVNVDIQSIHNMWSLKKEICREALNMGYHFNPNNIAVIKNGSLDVYGEYHTWKIKLKDILKKYDYDKNGYIRRTFNVYHFKNRYYNGDRLFIIHLNWNKNCDKFIMEFVLNNWCKHFYLFIPNDITQTIIKYFYDRYYNYMIKIPFGYIKMHKYSNKHDEISKYLCNLFENKIIKRNGKSYLFPFQKNEYNKMVLIDNSINDPHSGYIGDIIIKRI